MSTATELLRRARNVFGNCRGDDAEELFDEICAFLDAEPEAKPMAWRDHVEARIRGWRRSQMNSDGDRLSTSDLMNPEEIDDLVDYVCDEYTRPEPKVIAEIATATFNPKMQDPRREPEENDPVAWVEVKDTYEGPYEFHGLELLPPGKRYLYTRPEPAIRKPMTEEEMRKGSGEWAHLHNIFEEGIRFAEKHHGIDGNPSEIINNQRFDKFDPNSIDLQSRCRGDKL